MTFFEEHIVALMKDGDRRAISLIYDQFSKQLYGLALKMTGKPDAAQEVLQLSFIKIWKKARSYDPKKAQLFTWLYQITRNTALDYLRKKKRKQKKEIQITDRDVYINEEAFSNEYATLLNSEVAQLDENLKRVLNSIYYMGMTHVEAAEHLDVPLGTLKSRLRKAIKELRQIIKTILILILAQII